MIEITELYLSPGHNYVGHHGHPAGVYPLVEPEKLICVAGHGVAGDRYFDHPKTSRGQITFFAREVHDELCRALGVTDKHPGVFRRNVVTRGMDLNAWIGRQFELQGVRFEGTGECAPCYWMDQAFAPGAEQALKGRGGLRARILSDGVLRRGPAGLVPLTTPGGHAGL
jgi:MOSC domain-containing protein YiiM